MGIATRPVLGVLIAAAVLVAVGLLLHLSRDASGSLRTTLGEPDGDAPSSSLVGRSPVLAAPPVRSAPREGARSTTTDDEPKGPVTLLVTVLDGRGRAVPAILHVVVDDSSIAVPVSAGEIPYRHRLAQAATFCVRAESPRRNLWSRELRIFALPGSTHPVTLSLQGPRFRGRVLDARTDEPVSGADVRPGGRISGEPVRRLSSGWSTRDGHFDFSLLQDEGTGGSLLCITHGSYLDCDVPLPTSSEPIEVRLEPRFRCRGVVHADALRGIHEASVRAQLIARAGDLVRGGYEEEVEEARRAWAAGPRDTPFEDVLVVATRNTKVDRDGSFDFALRFPGEVRGYVLLPGHLAQPFTFFARRDAEPIDITLTPSPTRDARIRFVHADGSPFEGLRIWVKDDPTGELPLSIQFGKTDADGWYDTSALREGTSVQLSVRHPRSNDGKERSPPIPPFAWTVRHFETITVPD